MLITAFNASNISFIPSFIFFLFSVTFFVDNSRQPQKTITNIDFLIVLRNLFITSALLHFSACVTERV